MNTEDFPIEAEVGVSDGKGQRTTNNIRVLAHGLTTLSLRDIAPERAAGEGGGVTIRYECDRRALAAYGMLEDASKGYSATMPFMYPSEHSVARTIVDYSSAGMLLGAQPMMKVPKGTRFMPYAVVRNVAAKALDLKPTIYYVTSDGQVVAKNFSTTLLPFEVRRLNLAQLIIGAAIPDGQVTLKVPGVHPGDLLLATGSLDSSGTYAFGVAPHLEGTTRGRKICYWEVSGDTNTMITLWNYTDTAQDALVTFLFEGGEYNIPVHIEPKSFPMIDVAGFVRGNIPDINGHSFPSGATRGSVIVRPRQTAQTARIELTVTAQTYNVKTATCGDVCDNCFGEDDMYIDAGFVTPPGDDVQKVHLKAYSHDGTGGLHDVTNEVSWDTVAHSIATVNDGVITGVAPGTTNVTADWVFTPSNQLCWDEMLSDCYYEFYDYQSGIVFSVQANSADLENNAVNVTLNGPSGLSGTLTVYADGQFGSASTTVSNATPGSRNVSFDRTTMPADTYTSISAVWQPDGAQDINDLTLSRSWGVLGLVRHSQYNVPHESACTGSSATAWVFTNSCSFTQVTLKSDFISQTHTNGTGISNNYGTLHFDDYHTCSSGSYPSGANSTNSFLQVASITGSCGNTLTAGDSVATSPNPAVLGGFWVCQDNVLMVDGNNATYAVKHALDWCPICNTQFGGTNGHIDDFSSSNSCSAHDVGDLGNFYSANTH